MESDRTVSNRIDGPVTGPALQVGDLHGDVHIHYAPAAAPAPPADWGTGLPSEVRSLLDAQVQAAEDLPYRLPGAKRPSLAAVYVRQDLGHGSEEKAAKQHRPEPILDARGHLTEPPRTPVVRIAVRPPARTLRAALDADDNLVVTGGPGQGKSTLSLRLAADIAARWLSGGDEPLAEPVLPLRLTARELATRLALPFADALAGSARAEYGALLGCQPTAAALGGRVAGCRWLLLVDGLDEVADPVERENLVRVLARWAGAGSPYRLLLTTRPVEGAALAPVQRIGAARYELQPFDEEALGRFAANWFDEAPAAARFLRQVRAAHLDELVRVPLLATIAAIVFEQRGDRPLPDNQYELYEWYLKHLRSRDARPARFQRICDPLLEHLGRVRLEADTSLSTAAQEWVREHAPDLPAEELADHLTSAGPLVHRAGDLRFLHHSFAEHLAATAQARLLPDRFDPDHPDFARLLHTSRAEERGRHARAVLLHYAHLRTTEADRLIHWLHQGLPEDHLLAARLLAWHIPTSPEAVTAFLATARAWAMTTQPQGREILTQASRATHHPGLPDWLLGLMRDTEAPWDSRVEAATALATRLRGPETAEALAVLRQVTEDGSIAVSHRLAAAEALSECGGAEQETAERGLRSVLADPDATAYTSRSAAVVLAGLGGREHAVATLEAVIDNPWLPDDWRVAAATGLVEIGPEFHDRAVEVFRWRFNNRSEWRPGMRSAAEGLASLSPQHSAEAVAILSEMAADQRMEMWDRCRAVEALAELGPGPRSTAVNHLMAMAADVPIRPIDRFRCAQSLAEFGFPQQALELVKAALVPLAGYQFAGLYWVISIVAELGPDHRAESEALLDRLLDQPADSADISALGQLAGMGDRYRRLAVDRLRGILGDRAASSRTRVNAGSTLADLGPEFHPEVASPLLTIATSSAPPAARAVAWRALRKLGPQFETRRRRRCSPCWGRTKRSPGRSTGTT
ncbi:NACHT domain-containing protein [Actinokineospora sp. NPDC004072]